MAAQRDDGEGDPTKRQSHIAFNTGSFLSNDALIHRWTNDRLDATLEKEHTDLNRSGTTVGIQGNMAIIQNMMGIIAMKVGKGLGFAMQNANKAGPAQLGNSGASDETKPYTQDQVATLLGFHGAMNVSYLPKVWRLFKTSKAPNYDHLCRAFKSKMLRWADSQQCWIEEGTYFDNKTLDEWISLKFNLREEAMHGTLLSLQSFWHHSQLSSPSSLCILPHIVPRVAYEPSSSHVT